MTRDTELAVDWSQLYVSQPAGAMRKSAESMIDRLNQEGRIDALHAPLVSLLLKLADSLEGASGRGASIALLSAQYQQTWERLAALPLPETPDADLPTTYDVVLAPVEPADDPGR